MTFDHRGWFLLAPALQVSDRRLGWQGSAVPLLCRIPATDAHWYSPSGPTCAAASNELKKTCI